MNTNDLWIIVILVIVAGVAIGGGAHAYVEHRRAKKAKASS